MKNLINDIREFLKDTDPYEFRNNYETDADANADIEDMLQNNPEGIILYLSDTDDVTEADALITRIKVATL